MSFLKKFLNNLSEKSYDEKIRETKINLKKKQVKEYYAEYEPLSVIEYFWSKFGTNETFFGLSYKDYRSDYEKEYKERIVEVEQKNWSVKYEKESIEKELIDYIYQRNTIDLNDYEDPTFGKARGTDYNLFEDNCKILGLIKADLMKKIRNFFNSEVYFIESFFTILEGNGIVEKHNHLDRLDRLEDLDLYKKNTA